MFGFDEEIDRRVVPALKVHKMVLGDDGMDLFPAGVADMDFRAPPCVIEALNRRAAHGVFGYEAVPNGLLPALENWLLSRHNWRVETSQILRAPNVLNSLAMAANLFTSPGDGVIVQPPVFFDFADVIAENGRRLVANPLHLSDGRYEMDFVGLEHVASDPTTKMMFLCNPHNPVGRAWTKAELKKLGEICRENGVLVVSDEIHGDLAFPKCKYTPFASISEADAQNSITCLSPAKSFNIAACCSAFTLIPDEERYAKFQIENSRLTVNKNNAFASVAMEAAWANGRPWLDAAMTYIAGNLDLVRICLADIPEVDLIEPEGTFLLWFDFRKLGLRPNDLNTFLRKMAGWAITRGTAFGPEGAGFGRVNIACPKDRLARALENLNEAMCTFRK